MIPAEFIDELLAKIDVVDLIDEYVPLKKAGANYMACCPFHKEKSPSFTVSPSKQFYHCFGCHAHGSAIGFIMEYQGLSFVEAVALLAARVGMRVPNEHQHQESAQEREVRRQKKQSLEETLKQSAHFYEQALGNDSQAQGYLKGRGLNSEIIAHYGLGYAPDGWQPLAQSFQPYPTDALITSGMVIEKEQKAYDRFRHRVMFPIRNVSGQVIGFGGRVLDDSKPKYLNSPDTPLFDKGKNLYGLYEARAAIKEKARVLVVEGYMDVVALAQFGIGYAVAALGTATTDEHIKLLFRQTDNVYFCFDGDRAGRSAARRALENALPQLKDGKALHFLFLPEAHDPDSYIREYGAAQFEDALLNQSRPLSVYFWETLSEGLDLTQQESKAELVRRASPLLAQISAPTLAFLLKQELSEQVGIDPTNLAQLLGQAAPKRHIEAKSYRLPQQSNRPLPMLTLAQKQIRSLLINPQWATYIDLPEYLGLNAELACLATLARHIRLTPSTPTMAQLIESLRDTPHYYVLEPILATGIDHADNIVASEHEAQQAVQLHHFRLGQDKLLQNFRLQQISALQQKYQETGLSAEEKKLLLSLLQQRPAAT